MWSNPPQDILQTYAKEISDLKIVFLKYVSDEYLRSLYNGATLTMYPSRSEGFGFPILESFACGTPVMTCRNSCLQEIGRDVALYVGEDNVDEMVDVMKYFEKNLFNMELFKKLVMKRWKKMYLIHGLKKYMKIHGARFLYGMTCI